MTPLEAKAITSSRTPMNRIMATTDLFISIVDNISYSPIKV